MKYKDKLKDSKGAKFKIDPNDYSEDSDASLILKYCQHDLGATQIAFFVNKNRQARGEATNVSRGTIRNFMKKHDCIHITARGKKVKEKNLK